MSNAVKLSGKLGKDEETNGLDAIAERLRGGERFCVLAWIIPTHDNREIGTDLHQVQIQIVRAEPLGTPAEVSKKYPGVHEAYLAAFKERLGGDHALLPFDVFETVEGGYVGDVTNEDDQDD